MFIGAEGSIAGLVSLPDAYALARLSGAEGSIAALADPERLARASLRGAEGSITVRAFNNWAAAIDPLQAQTYHAMEIYAGSERHRIPIASWQATLQLDRASYVQCVVPAAGQWVAAILSIKEQGGWFSIYRGVRLEDGLSQEQLMVSAPLQVIEAQQGPTNYTATLSGYTSLPDPELPDLIVPLRAVRSRSFGSSLRIRCALDFLLRPGMQATDGTDTFTVGFINYYVLRADEYMDVGDRRDG